MKKAAVILFAAFYVLLSGGSYVCAMHCAAAKVIEPKVTDCCRDMGKMPMACHKTKHSNNDCTKKHGNFVVKENLKPSFSFNALKQAAIVNIPSFNNLKGSYHTIPSAVVYCQSKAPPPISGRAHIILLRSLLI